MINHGLKQLLVPFDYAAITLLFGPPLHTLRRVLALLASSLPEVIQVLNIRLDALIVSERLALVQRVEHRYLVATQFLSQAHMRLLELLLDPLLLEALISHDLRGVKCLREVFPNLVSPSRHVHGFQAFIPSIFKSIVADEANQLHVQGGQVLIGEFKELVVLPFQVLVCVLELGKRVVHFI